MQCFCQYRPHISNIHLIFRRSTSNPKFNLIISSVVFIIRVKLGLLSKAIQMPLVMQASLFMNRHICARRYSSTYCWPPVNNISQFNLPVYGFRSLSVPSSAVSWQIGFCIVVIICNIIISYKNIICTFKAAVLCFKAVSYKRRKYHCLPSDTISLLRLSI